MASTHGQMNARARKDVTGFESWNAQLFPVINYPPNRYGIRGLNRNIKEWGLRVFRATSRDKIREAEFVVLPSTIQRYPWEGFGDVGFRCVREVKISAK